jgi:hypothetical protein
MSRDDYKKLPRRMSYPLIHMNGTSAESLTEDLCNAYTAIGDAIKALKSAAPNQRDYYPLPVNWWDMKLADHKRRLKVLADLQDELEAEAELIRKRTPHDWGAMIDLHPLRKDGDA